jgi:hypothetical protein
MIAERKERSYVLFCRRRHQPRRPPLAKITSGSSPFTAIEGSVASLRLGDVERK